MNYYKVSIRYKERNPVRKTLISVHIVKANSLKDAQRIAEKYGIANPFHSKDIEYRHYKQFDMRVKYCKDRIKRRHKGIGGSVWYEDKNGKLQKETK